MKNNNPNQLFKLAYDLAFVEGSKTQKPGKKSFEYWTAASASGHARSMFYLGTCFDHGYGVKRDLKQAFNVAKLGHRSSQYNVGFFYAEVGPVKKNYKTKVYWYKLAAEKGLIDAQRDLGFSYYYGEGIGKDDKMAVKWYRKAAASQDDKALYNLGLCYKHGEGVTRSKRWALYYCFKADKFGNKKAKKHIVEIQKKWL